MSKEKKIITSEEFDLALLLIAEYKLQLDTQLKDALAMNQKINIQRDIKANTFRVLQKYYQMYYAMTLHWEDLKAMDRHLLETIDYNKIKFLKGYEHMSLNLLRKLMISHAIIDNGDS